MRKLLSHRQEAFAFGAFGFATLLQWWVFAGVTGLLTWAATWLGVVAFTTVAVYWGWL